MTKIIAIDPKTNARLGELNNRGDNVFTEDVHFHEIAGENSFTFAVNSKLKEAATFTQQGRFLIPSEAGNSFQEFIVHRAVTIGELKVVTGNAAYKELNKAHIVEPGKYTGTLQEIAGDILFTTRYRLGIFQDIRIKTVTVDEHIGAYDFLELLASTFEMELAFRVEISGTRFLGRYADFVEKIGEDVKREIVYGRNLVGIEMTEYSDRIVTRLIGIGPTGEDGKYLISVQEDEEAFQRWNDEGRHKIEVYRPETADQNMTQARLDTLTKMELKKRINSVVEYKVTAAFAEDNLTKKKLGLGYTLFVKNPEYEPPLYADARIIAVERSIADETVKNYTIGEVRTYTEEEVKATFRALQRVYGVKLIKDDQPPDGQPKTIWIDKSSTLNTPHTFNMETQSWQPFAPTSADQIGGLVVGRQYNGVAITPEDGIMVDRTDNLVRTVVNATEGISIETRANTSADFKKALYAGTDGTITLQGITIVRKDGYKIVDNGIMAFDYNIQGVEPIFLAHNMDIVKRGLGQWFVTETAGSADCNQYRFKHQGRYLKVFYRVLSSPGNTAHFEIWRGGEVVASAFTARTDEYDEVVLAGYTLTVDLGVPTGLPSTFQIRLRSSVAGLKSYGQIMGKWLEG